MPLLPIHLLSPMVASAHVSSRTCAAGLESNSSGLAAAAFTHGFYDLVAFWTIARMWGAGNRRPDDVKKP